MRIECPSCHFSADVAPEMIPPHGRNTKCPRCSTVFFAVPSEPPNMVKSARSHDLGDKVNFFRVCKVCGAESNYETNSATGDAIKCYNCDNDIPIKDDTEQQIESVKSTGIHAKNTGMPFIGVIFIISCLLPYLLLLMGYFIYGNVQSDKGWTLILYLFIAGGIFIFNAFAGLPILIFVKFNSGIQKVTIATMYIISAVIPAIFAIYLYLESAARRGN